MNRKANKEGSYEIERLLNDKEIEQSISNMQLTKIHY